MIKDPLDKIKADVAAKYAAFDAQRVKLIAAYQNATTPKARLKALTKIMRHHAQYVGQNALMGGWQTDGAFTQFAEQIEAIAEEL